MAQIINTLTTNLGIRVKRKFERAFKQLDDRYIIRSPILDETKIADLIIEGPNNAWLFIGYSTELPDESKLQLYRRYTPIFDHCRIPRIPYLAIIDQYEESDNHLLQDIQLIERDNFFNNAEEVINQYAVSMPTEHQQWLKETFISDAMVHSACTARQKVQKDNTAKLQHLFLDYDQEWAAKLDLLDAERNLNQENKFTARLINGVAGSGKTLILIKRAILYCTRYPDRKVLLLIHNKPITNDISIKFDRYWQGKPANLKILTFHGFAYRQKIKLLQLNSKTKIESIFDLKQALKIPSVKHLLSEDSNYLLSSKLTQEQLWSEVEYINNSLIADQQSYLEVDRQGRGFALQKNQRQAVWTLYCLLMERMQSIGGYLASLYIRELCLSAEKEKWVDKYHHILLDEAQFFEPSWFELVKAALLPSSQLFMCADPNQGFLRSRLSWKSVGINVRGRTKKLTRSYRTTYAILKAANALLEVFDEDPDEFLKPDFNKMEKGVRPHVIYSAAPQDELERFSNELYSCIYASGVSPGQILVLYTQSYNKNNLKCAIEKRIGNGVVCDLNTKKIPEDLTKDYIRIATLNSCTGLEAGVTFIVGLGSLLSQYRRLDLVTEERPAILQETYRKLYVAMTRAGQRLFMFSTELMPEELDGYVETENEEFMVVTT
ncbi:UvrD-helicase domain-containing protein [Zooshikella harenae]|uniref:DEAD/DEAH box helicase n=1 Tax=Zooshikella harenae TaxID=2827238 RepID=A0ABS5ZC44_9GAMM|nr:UvrD-helicase domain-containing protein [Zooshikella harenae]MBU2711634.1 DEAD/DEAH box helicase [Zooshikella harenae]